MKFVGLISGGKDSIYSICKLKDEGHELVALLHIRSLVQQLDSYMYQTVGTEIIEAYSKCLNVPLHIFYTNCNSLNKDLEYEPINGDEVEDLFSGIKSLKDIYDFEAVSSGAILSTYQKNRVENICNRLYLKYLAPLWQRNQEELLEEMIKYQVDSRIIKIANPGFSSSCINMNLESIKKVIDSEKKKSKGSFYFNYCGEGGEYESLVLNCLHFKKKIDIEDFKVMSHPEEFEKENFVFFMKIEKWKLSDK